MEPVLLPQGWPYTWVAGGTRYSGTRTRTPLGEPGGWALRGLPEEETLNRA